MTKPDNKPLIDKGVIPMPDHLTEYRFWVWVDIQDHDKEIGSKAFPLSTMENWIRCNGYGATDINYTHITTRFIAPNGDLELHTYVTPDWMRVIADAIQRHFTMGMVKDDLHQAIGRDMVNRQILAPINVGDGLGRSQHDTNTPYYRGYPVTDD